MPKFEIRRSDGRVQGPFSGTEIRAMAESGRIAPTDELRSQGSEKWVPASKVRGVREHLAPEPLDYSGLNPENAPANDDPWEPAPAESAADADPSQARASGTTEAEAPPSPSASRGAEPPPAAGPPPSPGVGSAVELGYIPQYGVLRSWARWFERWGWRFVRLALAVAAGGSVAVVAVVMTRWNLGRDAFAVGGICGLVATIAGWFLLGGVIRWMKARAALDQPFLLPITLIVLVPLALAAASVWFDREASLGFVFAAGQGLVIAVTGFGMVILGEWLFAHADIASNSWRRQPLPTSIHR